MDMPESFDPLNRFFLGVRYGLRTERSPWADGRGAREATVRSSSSPEWYPLSSDSVSFEIDLSEGLGDEYRMLLLRATIATSSSNEDSSSLTSCGSELAYEG